MPKAVPSTVVPGVEIARTGTWHASTGDVAITRAHLESAVAASNDPMLRAPIIKIGHDERLGDSAPAFGRVTNLRTQETADGGYALVGDLVMPEALAEIAPLAYPARSIEGSFDLAIQGALDYQSSPQHREYPFVMTAVALLGEALPAIESLSDLYDLYGARAALGAGAGVVTLTRKEATVTNEIQASIAINAVVDQFYDQLKEDSPNSWAYVQEVWSDSLIICGTDGELYKVPWTDKGDGLAEFGKPARVAVQYVPDPDSDEDGPLPGSLAQLSQGTLLAREVISLKKYTDEERKALAEKGQALPDGSFPIADVQDLKNAIRSIGRAKDEDKAKRFIKKRAKELDAEDLIPASWSKAKAAAVRIPESSGPSSTMSDNASTDTEVAASAATDEGVVDTTETETIEAGADENVSEGTVEITAAAAAEAEILMGRLPAGFEIIAASNLNELRAARAELEKVREEQRVNEREAFLRQSCEVEGRFAASQLDDMRVLYDSNAAACRAFVAKLSAGTVPTTSPVGHSVAPSVDDVDTIIARFRASK